MVKMMTNEEAKKSILVYCVEQCRKIDLCQCEGNECVEAIAIQALEKRIPKKPEIKQEFYGDFCHCPSCGEYMGYRDSHMKGTYNFCPNCGQAIDWNETK